MPDNVIQIDSGVRVVIQDNFGEERGVLKFNPHDILFADKFYRFYKDIQEKGKEFENKKKALDSEHNGSEEGFPAYSALAKEEYHYLCGEFNKLFGEGLAQKIIPNDVDGYQLFQVIEGVMSYFERARAGKVQKYVNTAVHQKREKHTKNK